MRASCRAGLSESQFESSERSFDPGCGKAQELPQKTWFVRGLLDVVGIDLTCGWRSQGGTQMLPPMTQLAPPLGPGSAPVAGIDLNVDYELEIRPFLGRCLVRTPQLIRV